MWYGSRLEKTPSKVGVPGSESRRPVLGPALAVLAGKQVSCRCFRFLLFGGDVVFSICSELPVPSSFWGHGQKVGVAPHSEVSPSCIPLLCW
jgi:hypothetical protein